MTKSVFVTLAGHTNAGKSSLLNALAGYDRAIVTDIPGTTRDTVEEKVRVGHVLLRLCDMHTIPVATNIATAEVLIHGLERGDLAWIELQRGRK